MISSPIRFFYKKETRNRTHLRQPDVWFFQSIAPKMRKQFVGMMRWVAFCVFVWDMKSQTESNLVFVYVSVEMMKFRQTIAAWVGVECYQIMVVKHYIHKLS